MQSPSSSRGSESHLANNCKCQIADSKSTEIKIKQQDAAGFEFKRPEVERAWAFLYGEGACVRLLFSSLREGLNHDGESWGTGPANSFIEGVGP